MANRKKAKNETGFKGVAINKTNGTYYAYIIVNGKKYTKHGFKTAKEAYEKGRLPLEDKYLFNDNKFTKDDVEKLNLPEGVRPVYNPLNITFRATYKHSGKELKKTFKTPQEAIKQREEWIKEYGEPVKRPPIVDLTGEKYGRLTVKKYAYKKGRHHYWECECDCGNTTIVQGNNLKSGSVVSCGCYLSEFASKNKQLDIKNQKFGKLTAIKKLDKKTSQGKTIWLCRCDCGNFTEAAVVALTSGNKIQCEACNREYFNNTVTQTMRDNLADAEIDGVQVLRFTDKPNRNSTSGYKGVFYNKSRGKYTAHIKVNGKTYTKSGFDTAKDAYYNGRLVLEDEHLPDKVAINRLKESRKNDGKK